MDQIRQMKEKIKKLGHNHALMMVVCCGVPLLLLLGAVYFFGLSRSYLFWFVLLLCPLSHYFLMKYMHDDKKDEGDKKCEAYCKKYHGCSIGITAHTIRGE